MTVRLNRRVVLHARFLLLGVPETEETKLAKSSWWRVWRAWTVHQVWVAWTGTTFSGKHYPSSVSIAQTAWMKAVQAMRSRWQLVPVDPIKGPPKLPEAISMLGMASQEEQRVARHY